MAWLLAHMWISLAAAGLFGLLFGWAIRGILVVGKLRTARVDRDVAKTELEQARAEIEGLYAAQRNVATGAPDPHLKAELNVREKRMTELSAELARSKAELQALKAGAGRGTATAAPAAAKPTVAGQPEEPTLLWRNRHLEGRVRHLEAALHEQATATQGASPAAISAPEATASVAAAAPEMDTTEIDKLKWQGDFLKQRVAALEAELASQPVAAVIAEPQPENDVNEELARLRWRNRFLEGRVAYFEGDTASGVEPVEDPADDAAEEDSDALISATDSILHELEEADAAADAEERDAADEEDDFEDEYEEDDAELDEDELDEDDDADEDDEAEDDDIGDDDEDDVEEGDESDDEEDSDEDTYEDDADDEDSDDEEDDYDVESDDDALSEDDSLDDDDANDEALEDVDSDEDELEDDAAEGDDDALADEDAVPAERPIALEKPVAGAPDDLTVIGGIGPKIQEVLNELGIYHYDQIAAWTPENIAWIDDRLNFSGRIAREGWVEQAAILSGDVADE